MAESPLAAYADLGLRRLRISDPDLYRLLEDEHRRQSRTLAMIAASSVADPAVHACAGTPLGNVTTEGYPGARFHAGCEVVDEVERLAVQRARDLFGARYANVQPHSGSTANQAVMFGLLRPGDVILGMELSSGGHLTHGSRASVSSHHFTAVGYGVDDAGFLDYDEVARLAREHRPRLIVCGASAYPRLIDFSRFRTLADEVGAVLLADISHVSGLVAAGLHPSPVDVAHVTTTSTYKQLYGPRGGLILMGRDADTVFSDTGRTMAETLQTAVFPRLQGTPHLEAVAAKGHAFALAAKPAFRALAERIVEGARALAQEFAVLGHRVITGGTDTHMVLIDLREIGITGSVAEEALETCRIIVNKNKIPNDPRGPRVTSGLRFGSNTMAARGMDSQAIRKSARLVDQVLRSIETADPTRWRLPESVRDDVRAEIAALCARHPLPYQLADELIPS
ncbi:serine hydroxymethyltransferase [Actinomadura sp. 6K520]|uniref:serine hydroxymethyltransferase n=1 Tax=Actinomadura sp. 6K520 TaxID=2530364 RepID=UPI00104F8FD8|nr:serine hydroxymethyltransferase [Actinomadura sp. 6K520]TDE32825.1 serine hydroxymethyltransferase [Actinomadura sp. 6K520]